MRRHKNPICVTPKYGSPEISTCGSPGPVNILPYTAKGLCRCDEGKDLEMEMWAQYSHKAGREEGQRQRRVMMGAEVRGMGSEDGGRTREQRAGEGARKQQQNRFSPEGMQPAEPLGLLTSRAVRYVCVVCSHEVCGHLFGSNRKLTYRPCLKGSV